MKLTILVCIVLLVAVSELSARGTRPGPRKAECSKGSESGLCPKISQPVCGTDGQTYDNECLLCYENKKNNKNIMIISDRPCPKGRRQ